MNMQDGVDDDLAAYDDSLDEEVEEVEEVEELDESAATPSPSRTARPRA
jgi:hypothetical protein